MTPLKQYFNRRLSLREAVAVIVIVAVLGGLGYAGYTFVAAKVLESRVNAAMPRVFAAIREQRGTLLSAIEAYRAHFGVYPADHVVSRQPLVVDAVNNPLLYELAGVVYRPTNQMFDLGHLESAEAKFVKDFFQCDGFKNCAESQDQVRHFLPVANLSARQLHDDPDVFAVGFTLPYDQVAPDLIWEFEISSWRYVSSSPTNNPGKFDLWLELKTKSRTLAIGNWKAVE